MCKLFISIQFPSYKKFNFLLKFNLIFIILKIIIIIIIIGAKYINFILFHSLSIHLVIYLSLCFNIQTMS